MDKRVTSVTNIKERIARAASVVVGLPPAGWVAYLVIILLGGLIYKGLVAAPSWVTALVLLAPFVVVFLCYRGFRTFLFYFLVSAAVLAATMWLIFFLIFNIPAVVMEEAGLRLTDVGDRRGYWDGLWIVGFLSCITLAICYACVRWSLAFKSNLDEKAERRRVEAEFQSKIEAQRFEVCKPSPYLSELRRIRKHINAKYRALPINHIQWPTFDIARLESELRAVEKEVLYLFNDD